MRSLSLEAGVGMLFILHDLLVVHRIADRTLVMHRGRILGSGHAETIWSDLLHPCTRALLAAIPLPDGAGHVPRAPADAARASWNEFVPEALERISE
jgi:oligopeptide transport system ATP-binding protein